MSLEKMVQHYIIQSVMAEIHFAASVSGLCTDTTEHCYYANDLLWNVTQSSDLFFTDPTGGAAQAELE